MPRSRDLAIFVLTDNQLLYPLLRMCARGKYYVLYRALVLVVSFSDRLLLVYD